uniref:Reverse transcriptase zinc-binding domain-containing protein n=1 Tax=Latimeria chalumnae TaxID=7897 RepID=H2ZU56_LATCH
STSLGWRRKKAQRKLIHCFKTPMGEELCEPAEIQKFAVAFYSDLFAAEAVDESGEVQWFFDSLLQVPEKENILVASKFFGFIISTCVLKINGGLSSPFPVQRGIWQGLVGSLLECGLLDAWQLLRPAKDAETLSLFWVSEEPVVYIILQKSPESLASVLRVKSMHFIVIVIRRILYFYVKVCHFEQLHELPDTDWEEWLAADKSITSAWRTLYKPPTPKRCGDLQWRILHTIAATNSFVSIINPQSCPSCSQRETVYHCFMYCSRLNPLFMFLRSVFADLSLHFSQIVFIFGVKYSQSRKHPVQLANFLLGQANLTIVKTRKTQL